jgi:putative phosphoribosyl transferase
MFLDREDAARRLAETLKGRALRRPLVLAIPRGGVATGAVLARELGAELDVILSRKLRAPGCAELAVGAVSEDGQVWLNQPVVEELGLTAEYLESERRRQLAEIARRSERIRAVRPRAPVAGRSVIVTDDGVATGATMIAALRFLKAQRPHEVLVAVPVGSPDRLDEIRHLCDEVYCLLAPANFWAVGQFYEDFAPVEDEQVLQLLREAVAVPAAPGGCLEKS